MHFLCAKRAVFLILMLLLILMRFMHEYNNYQIMTRSGFAQFSFFVLNNQTSGETIKTGCAEKIAYVSFTLPDCEQYEVGDEVQVTGSVTSISDKQNLPQIVLKVQSIVKINSAAVSGNAIIVGIMQKLWEWEAAQKQKILNTFPPPAQSIVLGAVFADNTTWSFAFKKLLDSAGAKHIVMFNSYSFALLFACPFYFARWFLPQPHLSLLALSLAIIFYVIFGFSVTFLRVVITAFFFFLAQLFQKQYHLIYMFVFELSVMLLINPFFIFDLSFMYGAASVAGVVLFMPLLSRVFMALPMIAQRLRRPQRRRSLSTRIFKYALQSFALILSLRVFTFPLDLFFFQSTSPLTIFPETVLLIFQPIILMSGVVFLICSSIPILNLVLIQIVLLETQLFMIFIGYFAGLHLENWTIAYAFSWREILICWVFSLGLYILLKKYVKNIF